MNILQMKEEDKMVLYKTLNLNQRCQERAEEEKQRKIQWIESSYKDGKY